MSHGQRKYIKVYLETFCRDNALNPDLTRIRLDKDIHNSSSCSTSAVYVAENKSSNQESKTFDTGDAHEQIYGRVCVLLYVGMYIRTCACTKYILYMYTK